MFLCRSSIGVTKKVLFKYFIGFIIFGLIFAIYPQEAKAAGPLTAISDTMTRLKAATPSNHTIQFTTPTGIANGNTITLTFAAGFDISAVVTGDVTLEGAAVTSAAPVLQVLTITAGAANVVAAAGTADIVISNNHITNPAVGSYIISIAGTFTDTGSFAVAIITNDQVVVSTTIDPYVTFILTTNSVTLTKNPSGNPSPTMMGFNQGAANTLEVYTNAAVGYSISYLGDTLKTTAGPVYSITALAAQTVAAVGGEQFGINLMANTAPETFGANKTGTGSGAVATGYETTNQFKFVVNTATPIASAIVASASNVYTVSYIANVSSTTEAGAYSTTITYICTGNF